MHAKDAAPATPLTAAERGHCIEAQKFPWLNCAVFIFYFIPHQHALVNFSSCELRMPEWASAADVVLTNR